MAAPSTNAKTANPIDHTGESVRTFVSLSEATLTTKLAATIASNVARFVDKDSAVQ